MRKDTVGDIDIIVGQSLFGDAGLRPKDSFGMRELKPADIALASHFGALLRLLKADVLRRLVFPQALERSLPDQSVVGPVAVFYLADEARLGPDHALLGAGRQGLAQCRLLALDLIEFDAQRRRQSRRPAGADTPGVDEFIARIVAQRKRTDGAARRRGREIAKDHKFLPLLAFGLEPVLAASGPVGKILSLGDDAFEAEPA